MLVTYPCILAEVTRVLLTSNWSEAGEYLSTQRGQPTLGLVASGHCTSFPGPVSPLPASPLLPSLPFVSSPPFPFSPLPFLSLPFPFPLLPSPAPLLNSQAEPVLVHVFRRTCLESESIGCPVASHTPLQGLRLWGLWIRAAFLPPPGDSLSLAWWLLWFLAWQADMCYWELQGARIELYFQGGAAC